MEVILKVSYSQFIIIKLMFVKSFAHSFDKIVNIQYYST